MDVIRRADLKVMVNNSMADFMGDDPETGIIHRDIDGIFLQ